ncbi:MAG: recombinase family protein [Phreatobacter sp.]|uniref:recombinase family protein n=1 Tax=Phreatobacter sp. TaxID=1966341 RepID=UPI001A43545D|nr:recombinase family protein [Phreatobacter sp.]MBL8571404.1 recombinase family protein [Phreatobacter sp.]
MRDARSATRSNTSKPHGAGAKRCAIYTRKSSEEGLEQDFNSLHAQREACEAYIASQRHEGWSLVPTHYDDGGYSGGSMERPGLAALMADVEAGRIDIVVVYKVDRLTRSLADFAKIVERFDARGISFVSVTQAFNTTSSMGRLTLNVLLSFAQFEREVTAERIRDKIAASKRKGLWMGGNLPFGYRVENRKLVPDEIEAEQIRAIFDLYLELGSIGALKKELDRRGNRTRVRSLASGAVVGGIPFGIGPLQAILRNRVYVGELVHRGVHHGGEHAPVVDGTTFDEVQQRLDSRRGAKRERAMNGGSLLGGLLFDSKGNRMSPSHSRKDGVRYTYYVSRALLDHRASEAGAISRVSMPAIDNAVIAECVARISANPRDPTERHLRVRSTIERVEVHSDHLALVLRADHLQQQDRVSNDAAMETISVPWRPAFSRPAKTIVDAATSGLEGSSSREKDRDRLLTTIARSRNWMVELLSGRSPDLKAIAQRDGLSVRGVRLMLNLAFVSPRLIEAAMQDRWPAGITASDLARDLPAAWGEQLRLVGLPSA